MLATVFRIEQINVTDAARRCAVPVADASQRLKALQARGLLSVTRQGRFAFYRAQANPKVCHAAALLDALRPALGDGERSETAVFRALTAFTHPRRIDLVRALAAGRTRPVELTAACRMSYPSVRRHLRKLMRRGIASAEHGRYRLTHPTAPFARALLDLALAAE